MAYLIHFLKKQCMMRFKTLSSFAFLMVLACSNSENTNQPQTIDALSSSETAVSSLPLEKIKLPPGFVIDVFAEVDNARSLAISPSGTIYVGNRNGDKVYAVKDTDGDFKADKKWVLASGL